MGPEAHGIDADFNMDITTGAGKRIKNLKTPKNGRKFMFATHCTIILDVIICSRSTSDVVEHGSTHASKENARVKLTNPVKLNDCVWRTGDASSEDNVRVMGP